MFGIGSTELLVILVVALVVLGPKSLPGLAKTLGKVMGEFKRVSTEFQRTMNVEVAREEFEKQKKEVEEELFGDDSKDASTAKTTPKATTSDKAESKIASADTADTTKNTASEDTPPSAETEISTPLSEAVDKVSAEANASEESRSRG